MELYYIFYLLLFNIANIEANGMLERVKRGQPEFQKRTSAVEVNTPVYLNLSLPSPNTVNNGIRQAGRSL